MAFEKVFEGEERRQKLDGRFRFRVRDVRPPHHTIQWHTSGILSTKFQRTFVRLGLGSKSLFGLAPGTCNGSMGSILVDEPRDRSSHPGEHF